MPAYIIIIHCLHFYFNFKIELNLYSYHYILITANFLKINCCLKKIIMIIIRVRTLIITNFLKIVQDLKNLLNFIIEEVHYYH